MNKYKKIATAVVATVMAGTMVASLAACAPKAPKTLDTTQTKLEAKLDANGALQYDADTQLNLNIGHEKTVRKISYSSDIVSGTISLPDGTQASAYVAGSAVDENSTSLKPAWRGLAKALDLKFVDKWGVAGTRNGGQQISEALNKSEVSETKSDYDIITGGANEIVTSGNSKTSLWLDLNQYLDLMPNYKDFLLKNPLVYMSLTSDTASGAMYYAPYFDGYDDIEKYTLTKNDWTRALLDAETVTGCATTFAGQASAKQGTPRTNGSAIDGRASSVKSFMGTDGYEIAVTDPAALQSGSTSKVQDGKDKATVTIKVDHQAALADAKDETKPLGAAMKAALGSAYTGNSGNIVDLQNAVIDGTQGAVTGAQLLNIVRAYIDVAYHRVGSTESFYTKRSDVFNSAYAAWDVDLYVAFARCVVTCKDMLKTATPAEYIYALAGRENKRSDRTNDVISLLGELYGIRGLESRTNYAYIDKNGTLQDARQDAEMYDAVEKANDMVKEGLILTEQLTAGSTSIYDKSKNTAEVWSIHDYSQTQTKWGFYSEGKATKSTLYVDSTNAGLSNDADQAMNANWDFAPILTAVSKWDIDGDGNHTDIMRFTESWRSTKDSGFCVPYAAVKDDPNKLSAVLKFIDYFFSNDGQILMTFGPQSTNGNGTDANGFWYGTEVTDAPAAATETFGGQLRVKEEYKDKYFAYNNKVYTGTFYKDHMAPTMTKNAMDLFLGAAVNGFDLNGGGSGSTSANQWNASNSKGAILSYTDYARGVIGGALPIGNKDQALEAQCTPDKVVVGQDIVAIALRNETVKHVYVEVDNGQSNNYWFTIVPSSFPYDPADAAEISDGSTIPNLNNVLFKNGSATGGYLISLMYWGYGDKSITIDAVKDSGSNPITTTTPADATAAIAFVNTYGDNNLEAYMQSAWSDLLGYYNEYISLL